MGDSPKIPWRLLDINLLVEDPETGGVYLKMENMNICFSFIEQHLFIVELN